MPSDPEGVPVCQDSDPPWLLVLPLLLWLDSLDSLEEPLESSLEDLEGSEGSGVEVDFALFAKTLESGFGHQDPEQNARDKLDTLVQNGSVEDYASRFQSLTAEIVTLPLFEGDKIQRFRNGLKAEMQTAAGIDPMTGKCWMDLGKFIDFACSVDATRQQAGKGSNKSGGSGSVHSGGGSGTYKEKLQGNKRSTDSLGSSC